MVGLCRKLGEINTVIASNFKKIKNNTLGIHTSQLIN